MPTLKLNPPKPPPPNRNSNSSSPSLQHNNSPPAGTFTFSAPPPASIPFNPFAPATDSPVAPEYSPITPKVQPVLPAPTQHGAARFLPPEPNAQYSPATASAIAPAEYIPEPSPLPFSSEDSTDAIALRAAISALQFQRKKAQDDLRTLESAKRNALASPLHFRNELVAGRLREQRPQFGGVQAILDRADSEDDSDEDESRQATLGAAVTTYPNPLERPAEIPDSQPSRPGTSSSSNPVHPPPPQTPMPDFTPIPGPQDIIRMPHIAWEKYHIVGSALDQLHEQQRRWPGSGFAYGGVGGGTQQQQQERGREFVVAAPYSAFLDGVVGEGEGRKDNGAAVVAGGGGSGGVGTGTGLRTGLVKEKEHPMETRRGSSKYQG
ncbi:hypothetical protein LTR48_000020 [Friedmanniomyces endolithicus]|uniref:Uncharacterized protein n=1 Tax=Rachicladosporium monterosium TaxID=1507873 RepID=A0ABR0LH82_9PEZI|nr:hypothetical protein LTR29_000336 [Friedmanniomyces endolithicus]KAK1089734.1 hypothetical protein LTR48_000020 [Friedmanniomyces endolithicus]KAK5148700.1 hypothetical protein LTR32_000058 [Rachicladosporium monterosium]